MQETFSIQFDGPAFERHEISASALAQSLLALDGLVRRSAEAAYGKDADVDVKVRGGFRPGSFVVDLLVEHSSSIGAVAGAVTVLTGVITLDKWAFGRKVTPVQTAEDGVRVENEAGQVAVFNQCVITVYNNARTREQLSRLTQTLDMDGAESIRLYGEDGEHAEAVTRQERHYFRREDGLVLTDNEAESVLDVVGARLDGSPDGWTFSEGENGMEFSATVEDEDFLSAVRDRNILLVNGTSLRAIVRTVQRKKVRTRTERTIVEVKEVFPPDA